MIANAIYRNRDLPFRFRPTALAITVTVTTVVVTAPRLTLLRVAHVDVVSRIALRHHVSPVGRRRHDHDHHDQRSAVGGRRSGPVAGDRRRRRRRRRRWGWTAERWRPRLVVCRRFFFYKCLFSIEAHAAPGGRGRTPHATRARTFTGGHEARAVLTARNSAATPDERV